MKSLSILLVIILNVYSFSQSSVAYGIKLSYVNSKISFNPAEWSDAAGRKFRTSSSAGFGFSVGVISDIPISGSFSFTPQILFSLKRSNIKYQIYSGYEILGEQNGTSTHYYMSVLPAISYKYQRGWGSTYLRIAPRFDLLLGYSHDLGSAFPYLELKNTYGSRMTAGTVFLGKVNPFIEFSYDFYFNEAYSDRNVKIKNQSFELSAGIFF